ncbi:MAG: DUF3108 domain-containing protein [Hyphomicrobium sp.]|nr:DUF3108 domain-containing protein [Hyphomicrobium sp.]
MAAWVAWKSVRGPICTALGIAAISSISLASPAHAAEPWPAEVQANYRIQFNGFEVGQFTFNSSVHERTYAISANADISALLGFVRWNGATRVSGALAGNGPRPAGYNFDFRGASKAGSIRMSFGSGAVTTINFNPPMPDPPGTVPVQPAHMRGVLDPLSAVLSLSRPKDAPRTAIPATSVLRCSTARLGSISRSCPRARFPSPKASRPLRPRC